MKSTFEKRYVFKMVKILELLHFLCLTNSGIIDLEYLLLLKVHMGNIQKTEVKFKGIQGKKLVFSKIDFLIETRKTISIIGTDKICSKFLKKKSLISIFIVFIY